MKQPTIIGVAGGTGSGKTTLANKIREALTGEDIVTICHDYYYKCNDDLSMEERKKLNYDHPNAFDTDLMIEDLIKLKNGEAIDRPAYSFVEHNRLQEKVHVVPAKIIIVEGILIFENEQLRDLMDIKVYVDTDADVRLIRRLMRDVKVRGRSLDSVVNQYLSTVKPMHEQFVEPSKKNVDIIIPEGGMNTVALDMLVQKIKSIIREHKAMENM